MGRSRTGLLLTVLIYAIAVTGQQSANSGGAPGHRLRAPWPAR